MKAKLNRKAKAVDVKAAQAHDQQPVLVEVAAPAPAVATVEVPALPANASAIAQGAHYRKLAGNPSKQAVIAVFGSAGYALSWVTRAARLGISAEDLCAAFKAEPEALKLSWEGHNRKAADSTSAPARQ